MPEVAEARRTPADAPEQRESRKDHIRDRRALALLVSLVLFLVLMPILEGSELGEMILIVSLYATLVTALLQFATYTGKRWWIVLTIFLAGTSMAFILLAHFVPSRPLVATSQGMLILFFGLIVVGLFSGLGQPGSITKARLLTSISLYLIIGMLWYAAYVLIETLHPGSFSANPGTGVGPIPHTFFLYVSMVTLTGLGTGDVVPASQFTRILVAMESTTGVLYVAITIARLVSAYQTSRYSRQ
jgi:hypothetical protein